ncbi:MAG TPA: hypothetical protein VG500_11070 [Gemmatimonadales bacterium]|jgi:hypothetical protein|nr:hypothetical protein [Gemmatimonadales bacterium]
MKPASGSVLYRRWILANGWAEAAGLGTTFLLGRALAPRMAASQPGDLLLTAAAAVALGTLRPCWAPGWRGSSACCRAP